jgi:REP element-mobilizing transposase RayT
MPRQSRIDTSGALHHVIGRGIDRQKIFTDQNDYLLFLKRLADLLMETRTSCFAWALIPNHFHLLLRTGNVPISILMKRLLAGYAINFNRRHNRCGHLFQNRYKSILCREDVYLLELVRYIHLNPLRAKLVSEYGSLTGYPYCGHGARGYDLDTLIKRVAQITQVTPDEIFDALRDAKRTKAGSILCYWATEKLGIPQSRLAQLLRRTQSAITYAVRRGKLIVEDNSYRIE